MLISLDRSKELEEKPEVEIGEKEKEAGEEGGKKSASRSHSRENNGLAIKQEEEEKQKKEVESVQAKRNYRSGCGGPEKKGAVKRFVVKETRSRDRP